MKLANDVFDISASFMKDPQYVLINNKLIDVIADKMIEKGKPKFPLPNVKDTLIGCILELTAAAVNYCYWYGKYNIRPGGASSTYMYELLMNSFFDFNKSNFSNASYRKCVDRFKRLLAFNRFPLLEERCKHLDELECCILEYCSDLNKRHDNLEFYFTELVELFPGFASDIFLKRASLFFIQLFRRFGWFDDELKLLHVPADYQIPKMLNYFGCIDYTLTLENEIEQGRLIPKNSLYECEIRSATIQVIKMLCEKTGWNVAEVDGFFFTKRSICTSPFHLTITTDY